MGEDINWLERFINKLFLHWAWWQTWFGPGTYDDWRNPFWRWTGASAVKPVKAAYLYDIRLGFKRDGKWHCYFNSAVNRLSWDWAKAPVTQNFWNGILTANFYVMQDDRGKNHWRVGLVIRPLHDWWLETGVGRLFDRGELAIKLTIMNWYKEGKIDAFGWDEGSV